MAAADAERLWSDLDAHERELRREGYQLREIWHKTTELHAENEKTRSELEGKARQNFVAPDTRINLNVGGQIFETTAGILCKDRWSVLAALCDRDEPIIAPDDDGTFFLGGAFGRDARAHFFAGSLAFTCQTGLGSCTPRSRAFVNALFGSAAAHTRVWGSLAKRSASRDLASF